MLPLGNFQGYAGWIAVRDASGTINDYRRLHVQVQLVRDDNSPRSDRINEYAVIKPASQGVPRLSGYGIRKILYIGTAPGNHFLAVAATNGGMTSCFETCHCRKETRQSLPALPRRSQVSSSVAPKTQETCSVQSFGGPLAHSQAGHLDNTKVSEIFDTSCGP
jgi:hypothetical protein